MRNRESTRAGLRYRRRIQRKPFRGDAGVVLVAGRYGGCELSDEVARCEANVQHPAEGEPMLPLSAPDFFKSARKLKT